MLPGHHGISLRGKSVPRPLMIAMSCPSSTRLATASFAKPLSARNLSANQGRSRIWRPINGIVFDNIPPISESPGPLSTITTLSSEHNLASTPNATASCLLASSLDFTSSTSRSSSAPLQKSTVTDGSGCAPSNPLQDSGIEELGSQDEVTIKGEREVHRGAIRELHTPLAFQIPKDVLQRAREGPPGTKESFWSHKMYLGPNNQEVKVHYCRSKHTTENVAQHFLNETVLGFDIEWKPEATKNSSIKSNVSLIQLASETRIALFHIAAFPKDTVSDLVAPTLKKIMEDAGITKVGVAIKADCTRLRNFLEINPRSIFELSHLYKLVKYSPSRDLGQINKRLVSLSTQAEEHLELPIFKGEVRGSDWTQSLSIEQIKYAASDAYANFVLYKILESKREKLRPVPPRPYHAELNLPIRLAPTAVIAATDDVVEGFESESIKKSVVTSPLTPESAVEDVVENIQTKGDAEQDSNNFKLRTRLRLKAAEFDNSFTSSFKPQPLVEAELWASAYRLSNIPSSPSAKSPSTVNFSTLRVYALWHYNSSLSIADIASMLRDPPLRSSTVATYLLNAVRLENLPFEKERLKEVLQIIPDSRGLWRYKSLWKMVE